MILEKLNWMDQALTLFKKVSEFPKHAKLIMMLKHSEREPISTLKKIGICNLLKIDTSQLDFLVKNFLLIAIHGFSIMIEINVGILLSIFFVDSKMVEGIIINF